MSQRMSVAGLLLLAGPTLSIARSESEGEGGPGRGEVAVVDIEKTTNGAQADDENDADVPVLSPGDLVTWTYQVQNSGAVAIALADVTVTDSVVGVTPVRNPASDVGSDGVL